MVATFKPSNLYGTIDAPPSKSMAHRYLIGATFTGTDRLKAKESDRGIAMHEELRKLGGGLIFGNNTIAVPKQSLSYNGEMIDGHNDHRIVMAMSVILYKIGGLIKDAEAIKKSYPRFFEDIKQLGAEVTLL